MCLREGSSQVKIFTRGMLDSMLCQAALSPRFRQHLNVHESFGEPAQRLFNAIRPDSYIRPHRHSADPKAEFLLAVRGAFAVIRFDDLGDVIDITRVDSQALGCMERAFCVEIGSCEWHTVVALDEEAILLEVKNGPFEPSAAKVAAPWAPEEGSPDAVTYLRRLLEQARKY